MKGARHQTRELAKATGIFVGVFSLGNVRVVDEEVNVALINNGYNPIEVYRTYRSCYFPDTDELLAVGDNVVFASVNGEKVGEVMELLQAEDEGEVIKFAGL